VSSDHVDTVVLWYDDFHTPVRELLDRLPGRVLLLDVDLGAAAAAESVPVEVYRVDAVEEYVAEFLLRAIRAQAVYQDGYLLSAALSRPLLARQLAAVAGSRGATSVVHGLAGNDQLRLELALAVLAPELRVQSVAGLLGSQNRRNAGAYTISENLWGRSAEAAALGEPARMPGRDAFVRCAPPLDTPPSPEVHTVGFDEGRPCSLDGAPLDLRPLIEQLDGVAGRFGVGFTDLIEDGYVGLKTRAVYESPAATALLVAHRDLQRFVCSRRQNAFAAQVSQAWSELVYDGLWFDPVRESLEAYVADVNENVTGEVSLLFRHGGVAAVGRRSARALYDEKLAVYRVGQDFSADLGGFVAALSAPMRVARRRNSAPVLAVVHDSAEETRPWNG
jgi:argininosuccinate synthase